MSTFLPSSPASDSGQARSYFTRSKLVDSSGWKAGGVLPFAMHEGNCWVLLGAEMTRTGPKGKHRQLMWRDFGGQREAIDEDAVATASRECSEETLGMLFGGSTADEQAVRQSTEALKLQLRGGCSSMCTVHRLRKSAYHMFICQSSFVDPLMFALATEQNAARASPVVGAEKVLFAWVMMVDVLKAVAHARKSYFLHTQRRIVSRSSGHRVPRKLMLHPCFANSLRIAKETGLVPLIKACQDAVRAPACQAAERQDRGPARAEESTPAAAEPAQGPLAPDLVASPGPDQPAGLMPMHLWWTLLQHDVARSMAIAVPPEAARYIQQAQGETT